jgi:FkbM family methyltransferase
MTENYTILRRFRHGAANLLLCLKHDSYIGRAVERYGEYSEAEVDVFRQFVGPTAVVIDGGALFGEHTLALADLCPAGHVIAFEPQRIPFQMLCGNCQLNSVDNVDAERAALGAAPGRTRVLPLSPYADAPWGMATTGAGVGDSLPVRTIDSYDLKRLDFVKLDLEGCETDAIVGGLETIRRCRPVLYVEFNYNRAGLLAALEMAGYSSLWRHAAPVHREPNYLGRPVTGELPVPSDMVLALPAGQILPGAWLDNNGFRKVEGPE